MLSITKKAFWGFFIALVIAQAIVLPLIANAQEAEEQDGCSWYQVGCHMKSVLIWFLQLITYLSGSLGGLLLMLAAGLVDLLVDFNIGVLGQGSLVTLGFSISLNIVNLLFVLALIIIAFGTILRIQAYGMKQLLAKLIIAAILINFSLAIAGLLLDFSHVFTKFFLSGGQTAALGYVSDSLAGALQPQFLTAPPEFESAQIAANNGLFWTTIMSSMFHAIFTWMLAIVMLGVAFMFLIRYFYVVILLILMPFAWFFWVVPEYSSLTKKWWNKFLEQVFFLPGMAFFIYLAIQLEAGVRAALDARINNVNSQAAAVFSESLGSPGFFQTIFNQIIIGGILVGGLIAAQKMGIAGSATAMGMAKWSRGAALKVAKAPVQYLGARPTKAVARGGATLLGSRPLRWIPGAQGAANRLAGLGSRQQEVDDYAKENLANLTNDQFESQSKALPVGPVAQAAVLKEAARRKMLAKFNEDQLKKLATAAQQTNPGVRPQDIATIKEILSVDPTLAPTLTGQKVAEVVDKMNPDKVVENFDGKYLDTHPEVVLNLNRSSIAAIKRRGSDAQNEAIRRQLETATGATLKNINTAIATTRRKLKEAQEIGNETESEALRVQLHTFVNTLKTERKKATEEQIKAYDKLTIVNQIIGEPLT